MEEQTNKNNLKKLRIQSGLSQKDFYEKIIKNKLGMNISLRTYQNWENPNNEIKSKPALQLAEHFNVNIGELLGYNDNIDYISKKTLKALDKFKEQGIVDYLDIERISEADEIIKDFLGDQDKFKRYQETQPLQLSMIIKNLLEIDNIKQTSYANLLLNYQVLEENDQERILDLTNSLADKTISMINNKD
jgi:phage transcriptional regulator, cro/CI family